MGKFTATKEELEQLYLVENLTLQQIGDLYNCGYLNVRHFLKKYGIPMRSRQDANRLGKGEKALWKRLDRDTLYRLYIEEQLSADEIAKRYGCAPITIRRYLKEFNIRERSLAEANRLRFRADRVKLSNELLRSYINAGKSTTSIAEVTGYSVSVVYDHLKLHGIVRERKPRRLKPERSPKPENPFFRVWSPEMAWVLGLMFSDGNVSSALDKASLYSIDVDMLEQVKQIMGINLPVRHKQRRVHALNIGASRVVQDLIVLGCIPNKSLVCEFPNVPEGLLPHFIRGLWDGDGHISTRGTKITPQATSVYVSGSYNFIWTLRERLLEQLGIEPKFYAPREQRCYCIRYNKWETITLLKWMYKDSTSQPRLC